MWQNIKNWHTIAFSKTFAWDVQDRRGAKLPSFSVSITWLPPEPVAVPRSIPPDVSKVEWPLAYRLRLIYTEVLVRNMPEPNSKKAQTGNNKGYGKHDWFERCFPAAEQRFRWTPHTNGICCGPYSHRKIRQATASPHTTISGYHCWIRVSHNRLRRYPEYRISQPA